MFSPLQLFDTLSLRPPLIPHCASCITPWPFERTNRWRCVSQEVEQPAHQRFRITGSGKRKKTKKTKAKEMNRFLRDSEWNQPTRGWNQTYQFLFSGRLRKRSAFHRAAAASDAFCSRRFSSHRRERRSFSSGRHGCRFS